MQMLTHGRMDIRTEGQTDVQTDGQQMNAIYPLAYMPGV